MTTTTDTLRGALDSHDRGVPDKSVGEHDAPISAMRSLREDDDLQLIARVAAKDQRAITILYQRYAPRLGRFLSTFLKCHTLVNEAVNDVRRCQQIMFTSAIGPDNIVGWTTNRALPRSSRRFVA